MPTETTVSFRLLRPEEQLGPDGDPRLFPELGWTDITEYVHPFSEWRDFRQHHSDDRSEQPPDPGAPTPDPAPPPPPPPGT